MKQSCPNSSQDEVTIRKKRGTKRPAKAFRIIQVTPGESQSFAACRFPRTIGSKALLFGEASLLVSRIHNRVVPSQVIIGTHSDDLGGEMQGKSTVADVVGQELAGIFAECFSPDENRAGLKFLQKSRALVDEMTESRDHHAALVDEYEGGIATIERFIGVVAKAVDERKESEKAQKLEKAQEPDMWSVTCGKATAKDIKNCRKFRHALEPIAKRNGGVLELGPAVDLIMAVMKPKSDKVTMKGSLGKFIRTSTRWERIGRATYRLMEVGDDKDRADGAAVTEVTAELQCNAELGAEAA